MNQAIDAWLAAAVADARRRGLPELEPLLQTLAKATAALRSADARLDDATMDDRERAAREDSTR